MEHHSLEELRAREASLMELTGWYAHYVFGQDDGMVNAHTHGIAETFEHRDFQIVLPVPPPTAHGIFINLVSLLKRGFRFMPGEVTWDIIDGYAVTFEPAKDGGREVLRVILPDKNGSLDPQEMAEEFRRQWSDDDE